MLDRLLEDKKRGARIAYICDHNTQYRMLSLDGIIDALTLATNDALRAAVERVRALHKPPPNTFESVWFGNDGQVLPLVCNECGENLPCPTLRALEETP